MAELILSSINSSLDTWDQSAGGTLIEQSLIDWTCKQVGFDKKGDGIFTSGGTQSNLMAMLLARDHGIQKHFPNHSVKEEGLPALNKFKIFTSEISHFSVQKSAAILGLGYNSVETVSVDECFKMDTQALLNKIEEAKQNGFIPIAVVATTGTTDFGSIDPVNEIADVCEAHDIWLHIDAAYGCGLLASEKNRYLLNGIERANSLTADFHKSFFQPVSCGGFFVKDAKYLSVVTHHAEYLNPLSTKQEGIPNLVDKSIQTTRRFDALKLWITFRLMGPSTIGKMFDDLLVIASRSYEILTNKKDIEAIHQPQLSALVFRYLPKFAEFHQSVELENQANEYIRKAIFKSGRAVIASTKVKGVRFLKFTLLNPTTTDEDIEEIVSLIEYFGNQFYMMKKAMLEGSDLSDASVALSVA